VVDAVKNGTISLPEPARSELIRQFSGGQVFEPGVPVPEAAAWPELADAFLRSCLG
jgi:hypothetical protein